MPLAQFKLHVRRLLAWLNIEKPLVLCKHLKAFDLIQNQHQKAFGLA